LEKEACHSRRVNTVLSLGQDDTLRGVVLQAELHGIAEYETEIWTLEIRRKTDCQM
jgi:hypothetical protein